MGLACIDFQPSPPFFPKDIDYGWTALYASGLIFNIAYLVLEGALVGWIFLIVETALIFAVIAYKLALERPWRARGGGVGDKAATASEGP